MLSKCANPGCPAPFLYLHAGKLFRLDTSSLDTGTEDPVGQTTQKTVRNLEFFWLCDECAAKLTLSYRKGIGITAIPIPETPPGTQGRSASAS